MTNPAATTRTPAVASTLTPNERYYKGHADGEAEREPAMRKDPDYMEGYSDGLQYYTYDGTC